MPSRFVAPKRVETFEDVRKALARLQEQLDNRQPKRPELIVADTTLRAGESVRISPRQGATIYAKLPKAGAENFGAQIHILVERPAGTLRVAAERPDTVAGLPAATFTLAGLIVLESNGTDQWMLVNQLPTNSPAAATNYFFSNANNVTFGTAGSTVTASVTVASTQASLLISAGTTSVLSSAFTFTNANNVSWTLATNGVLQASATVASTQASIVIGTLLSSRFSFINSNNVSWTINATGGINASASFPAATAFVLSNANGLTWGTAGSTVTGSYSQSTRDFVVAHVGGNSVSNVTRLNFSNASNVTFSLSTVPGAATLFASVAAAAGGGVAISDPEHAVLASTGTVAFRTAHTLMTQAANLASFTNVIFGLDTNQSLTAMAMIRITANNSTNTNGFLVSRLNFENSNGVTFGVLSTTNAEGKFAQITASYAPLAIGAVALAGASPVTAGTVNFTNFNFTADQRGFRKVNINLSNTSTLLFDWEPPRIGAIGMWNQISGTGDRLAVSFNTATPFFFLPFPSGQFPLWGKGNEDHRIGDWYLLLSGNSAATNGASSTRSLFLTVELGLFSVEGSIGSRLLLVNSASRAFSFASSQGSLFHGARWLELDASNWASSTGPLTYGEYVCAWRLQQNNSANSTATAGRNDVRLSILGSSFGATGIRGLFGGAVAADSKWFGWGGHFSTTTGALPGTVVSSNLVSSIANAAFIPGLSVRAASVSAGFPGP